MIFGLNSPALLVLYYRISCGVYKQVKLGLTYTACDLT